MSTSSLSASTSLLILMLLCYLLPIVYVYQSCSHDTPSISSIVTNQNSQVIFICMVFMGVFTLLYEYQRNVTKTDSTHKLLSSDWYLWNHQHLGSEHGALHFCRSRISLHDLLDEDVAVTILVYPSSMWTNDCLGDHSHLSCLSDVFHTHRSGPSRELCHVLPVYA